MNDFIKKLVISCSLLAVSAWAEDDASSKPEGEVIAIGESSITIQLAEGAEEVKPGDLALFKQSISERKTAIYRGEAMQIVDGSVIVAIDIEPIEVGMQATFLSRAPLQECDEIASIPGDPFSVVEEGMIDEKLEVRTAIEKCSLAAEKFPFEPRFHAQLGRAYEVDRKPARAVLAYQKALEIAPDYPLVLNALGSILFQGPEELRDYDEARKLFTRAAEQGFEKAMPVLGLMCRDGLGGDVDNKSAAHWFALSAETGSAYSQNALGECYEFGWGVDKDISTALLWYRSSAELDYTDAMINLGHAFADGKGVSQNAKKAFEWYSKAAAKEDKEGLFQYAMCVLEGRGAERNFNFALEALTLSADKGNPKAMRELANIYYQGDDVKRDYNIAASWFEKAAKLGDVVSQFNMGVMSEKGQGLDRSRDIAIEWYRAAAQKGHNSSQKRLLALKEDW